MSKVTPVTTVDSAEAAKGGVQGLRDIVGLLNLSAPSFSKILGVTMERANRILDGKEGLGQRHAERLVQYSSVFESLFPKTFRSLKNHRPPLLRTEFGTKLMEFRVIRGWSRTSFEQLLKLSNGQLIKYECFGALPSFIVRGRILEVFPALADVMAKLPPAVHCPVGTKANKDFAMRAGTPIPQTQLQLGPNTGIKPTPLPPEPAKPQLLAPETCALAKTTKPGEPARVVALDSAEMHEHIKARAHVAALSLIALLSAPRPRTLAESFKLRAAGIAAGFTEEELLASEERLRGKES